MTDEDLSFEEITEGLCVCAYNAQKLAQDSRRLYSRKRYSSALFLGIASLEECGKVFLLLVVHAAKNMSVDVSWKEFWRDFLSHEVKDILASILDLTLHGQDAATLAIRALFFQDLPRLRERAIYVDYESGRWILPEDVPHDWAFEVVDAAKALSEEIVTEFNKRRLHLVIRELKEVRLPLEPGENPEL